MATIYTIGHSTRTAEEFFTLLRENNIAALADVRRFPVSRRYPHFNRDALEISCNENNIQYLKQRGWTVIHILSLGRIQEHPFTTVAQQQQLF